MPNDPRRSSDKRNSRLAAVSVAFGRVLQEIRNEKSLSQEELGFDSGYHRTYVSLLERGLKNPSLSAVFKISAALHLAPSEVVRRVEEILQKTN